AEGFLRERPLRELTIDEVMAGTGLSRPAFYVYFRDRHDLVLRLIAEIGSELFVMADRWLKGGDLRAGVEGVVAVYAKHGRVLRAISDAAVDDPDVEDAYHALVQRFIDATSDHIRSEQRNGRAKGMTARRTAAALVWMNERYLSMCLGGQKPVRAREVAETLHHIWMRALYMDEA
ncbi:MAG: TetR/AcrR family transcriptional regulator, ethionamide resistance regulator, partial [Thermoleophilaceae bacterium]|nr:TetR/AcrR family transcriptional regulator, ethionamide resistance regulator [Thermoleophilaceae bacterium]